MSLFGDPTMEPGDEPRQESCCATHDTDPARSGRAWRRRAEAAEARIAAAAETLAANSSFVACEALRALRGDFPQGAAPGAVHLGHEPSNDP